RTAAMCHKRSFDHLVGEREATDQGEVAARRSPVWGGTHSSRGGRNRSKNAPRSGLKIIPARNTTTGTSLSNTRGCRTVSRWQNKTNHTPLACRQRQDIRPPLALLFVLLGLRSLGRWCNPERVRTSPSR